MRIAASAKKYARTCFKPVHIDDHQVDVGESFRLRKLVFEIDEHLQLCFGICLRGLDASVVLKIRRRAYRVLESMTLKGELILTEFDEGVELRPRSANKSTALLALLQELAAEIPVAYLGDDVDDEDAFGVLNGRGLTALIKPKTRFTAAQMILRPPDELIGFLREWIRLCAMKRERL